MTALFPTIAFLLVQAASPGSATLEEVRRLLADPQSGGKIGSIGIDGRRFARELEIGAGLRVVVISLRPEGGIAAFRADGSLLGTQSSGEITSVELFDLDEDGTSELMTEEVEGRGTGVLMKTFVLYGVSPKGIQKLWSGESHFRSVPWNPGSREHAQERYGFLRCDPSGGGRTSAQMTYLAQDDNGKWTTKVYELHAGKVIEQKR